MFIVGKMDFYIALMQLLLVNNNLWKIIFFLSINASVKILALCWSICIFIYNNKQIHSHQKNKSNEKSIGPFTGHPHHEVDK